VQRTLRIGPAALEWRINDGDTRWQEFLDAYAPYADGDLPPSATLAVEAEIAPWTGRILLPESLVRVRQVSGPDFDIADGLIAGSLPEPDRCLCRLHPALLAGNGLRVLEQFFYLLFYQAVHGGAERTVDAPFLLHAAAALAPGGVHVFCGPSQSGKSTAIGNSRAYRVLTDEAVVITPTADGFRVEGSPINPFCTFKQPGGGPLAGIYLLAQAPQHELRPLAREDGLLRLTQEVMIPLGPLETNLAVGSARALDCAARLWASRPVRELRLMPDPGFWRLLEP
jgi:hypothetical protein